MLILINHHSLFIVLGNWIINSIALSIYIYFLICFPDRNKSVWFRTCQNEKKNNYNISKIKNFLPAFYVCSTTVLYLCFSTISSWDIYKESVSVVQRICFCSTNYMTNLNGNNDYFSFRIRSGFVRKKEFVSNKKLVCMYLKKRATLAQVQLIQR